jgi:hypothetical protein
MWREVTLFHFWSENTRTYLQFQQRFSKYLRNSLAASDILHGDSASSSIRGVQMPYLDGIGMHMGNVWSKYSYFFWFHREGCKKAAQNISREMGDTIWCCGHTFEIRFTATGCPLRKALSMEPKAPLSSRVALCRTYLRSALCRKRPTPFEFLSHSWIPREPLTDLSIQTNQDPAMLVVTKIYFV